MRLLLFRLGVVRPTGAPVPGALIQLDDGTNVLVDTGARRPEDGGAGGPSPAGRSRRGRYGATGAGRDHARGDPHLNCTHFDPDHAGYHDAFPGAEFIVQRAHYEQAKSGQVNRLELARPFWDRPELSYRLVDGDTQIRPGVEVIESSGHVAGHQSVLVRLSGSASVLLAADAIPLARFADAESGPTTTLDLDGPSAVRIHES